MDRIATRSVALIGFMGTGKTTVGKRLARRLGYRFVDSDAEIERRTGASVRTIFLEQGEPAFRSLESETIAALAVQPDQVISTGGGTVLQPNNAKLLRSNCLVVWLTASPGVILKRVGTAETRPLLADAFDPLARIRQLLEARSRLYEAAAHLRVDTTDRRPEAVAEEIVASLSTKLVTRESKGRLAGKEGVRIDRAMYRGRTGRTQLYSSHRGRTAGFRQEPARSWHGVAPGKRVCIVTHPVLQSDYAAPLAAALSAQGFDTTTVTLPAGERFKHLNTVARLYRDFIAAGLDRKSLVVAVGGGVLGDTVGFAAATYLRGIPFVQVPTTLLAQVDASVGGKTGVDLPQGKNLVGAFHQPSAVVIDTVTLRSLPLRELRSGLSEVIKYGIIYDKLVFDVGRHRDARPLATRRERF